jgi:hypothetical protein
MDSRNLGMVGMGCLGGGGLVRWVLLSWRGKLKLELRGREVDSTIKTISS